jgi:hypothetical protein
MGFEIGAEITYNFWKKPMQGFQASSRCVPASLRCVPLCFETSVLFDQGLARFFVPDELAAEPGNRVEDVGEGVGIWDA